MKHKYITPESEILSNVLSCCILEDSSLVDYYGGEDATSQDGQW